MKRIRYLFLLLILLCGITARAQDDTPFNPNSPVEPDPVLVKTRLTLAANPSEGGWPTGEGKYVIGEYVNIKAYPSSGFVFVNWTTEDGTEVSTDESYSFQKADHNEMLIANYRFAPNAPVEPDEIMGRHRLKLIAEEGGSVSGEGIYDAGSSVTVNAYTYTGFDFIGWYDGDEQKSTDNRYTFPMEDKPLTLTAKFKYTPDSPIEPDELINLYRLNLSAEEGGSVNVYPSGDRFQEGTSLTLYAYTNTGYEFTGWYKNGEFYSPDAEIVYVMDDRVSFKAHYKYAPDSPEEPESAGERKYSFTLYNINCKPGDTVEFPVYLTWKETVKNMSFQMTFKSELHPDLDNVMLSEKATEAGYKLTRAEGYNIAGNPAYVFSLKEGTLEGEGNTVLLKFSIPIPDDMETGLYYPVTINQVSMTNKDDETETAGVHNGRVSVYKLGDSNGDNKVDIKDKINAISFLLGDSPKVFIKEVGDVNNDNEITVTDALVVDELMEPSGDPGSE